MQMLTRRLAGSHFHIWKAHATEVKCFHPFHRRLTTLIFAEHTRLSTCLECQRQLRCLVYLFIHNLFIWKKNENKLKVFQQWGPSETRTASELQEMWLRTIIAHTAAIKACGLFKMAENQFNETKWNQSQWLCCFIAPLSLLLFSAGERKSIILRGENKTKPNPGAWLADNTNTTL